MCHRNVYSKLQRREAVLRFLPMLTALNIEVEVFLCPLFCRLFAYIMASALVWEEKVKCLRHLNKRKERVLTDLKRQKSRITCGMRPVKAAPCC